jgi:hypothetical protein
MLAHLANFFRELLNLHMLAVLILTLPPWLSHWGIVYCSCVCLSNIASMLLSLFIHDVLVRVLLQVSRPLLVCLGHLLPHDLLEHTVPSTRRHVESLLLGLTLSVNLLLFILTDDLGGDLLLSGFLESALRVGLPLDVVELGVFVAFGAELLANGREYLDLIVNFNSVIKD